MGSNKNLKTAKKEKNDEFYTRIEDIQKEVFNYKDQFKDKVVLCNCDDPRVSQFFNYFFLNFKFFRLKKLIATCYKNQQWDLFSDETSEKAVYIVYEGEDDDSPMPREEKIRVMPLDGDGDFRSPECKAFLELADIVVTNPPFSLFREFVSLMEQYKKKYLIIGNKNSITYKEIFPLFKENKLWMGIHSITDFKQPDGSIKKFGNVGWFTNMPIKFKNAKESVILYKKYNEKDYPKYDNYDAINVNKVADIPVDYFGEIGVPVTFFDKWNPNVEKEYDDLVTTNDFEIIGGFNRSNINEKKKYCYVDSTETLVVDKTGKESTSNGPVVNKQALYYRIIIKRKR